MTTPTIAVAHQSIVRIDPADASVSGPLTAIYGKVQNIAGGQIMYPTRDEFGPHGIHRTWDGTFSIENLTFELLDASEQPESLGPIVVHMNVYTTMYLADGTLASSIRQYRGRFLDLSWGQQDRTTQHPRPLKMAITRIIAGGNADRRGLTSATAALYADSETGEHSTRAGGTGTRVDHYGAILTAHGVTAPVQVGGGG